MVLIRLHGKVLLAMDLEIRRDIKSNYFNAKTEFDMDNELIGYWWNLESCEEAIQLFEDFYQCPVCGAIIDRDGVMVHRENFIN